MKYKKSKFNFWYKRDDDTYVIYNTYSKALVELNSAEFSIFQADNEPDENNAEMEQILADNGILVEDSFDETEFLSYCHNMTKFAGSSLHLVIATTMDCNFACPYCYENRREGKMSEEIQNAIVQFIEQNLISGVKELDVTWYGGEPLLYPVIIYRLSERIKQACNRYKCKVTMYMVTNGYLLTPEIVELIDIVGIIKMQITVDGLKMQHDKRRHLRNGDGTFDKIYKNLKLFEEYSIRVDVRMNVDNENYGDYIALKELLKKLDNPNIILYPSPVEDINRDVINEVSDFMTFDEFEHFTETISTVDDSITAVSKVLDDRYCYCQAETENSYVIDELGNFYKCWDQIGRVEMSCFNIQNIDDKSYQNILPFLAWNPFQDEKCGQCIFLPLCFGGCKFHRMRTGRYDCGFTDQSMKKYIENSFFGS